ncbi:unnamed protein product [Camellia sinensis]
MSQITYRLVVCTSGYYVTEVSMIFNLQDFGSVDIDVMMNVTILVSLLLLLQFYYYCFGSVLITGKPDDVYFCLNEVDDSSVDAILMLLVIF